MAAANLGVVIPHIARLLSSRETESLSDCQLLRWFASNHDQLAFAAIVQRHGRLVLNVCHRLLRHVQDSEDAFQATFLVLARRAGSIRKQESLATWLHGVAYRMSMKVKRDAARRRRHESNAAARRVSDNTAELTWSEAQSILDDELLRLPEKYRAAFMLCCQDGESRAEAARRLGINEGTLSSRLATARQRLQKRLALRGVTLSAAVAAAAIGELPVSAAMADAAVRAAAHFAAAQPLSGIASAHVIALANGALKSMVIAKLRVGLSLALAVGMLSLGAGLATQGVSVGEAKAAPPGEATEKTPHAGVYNDITAESGVNFTYRNGEDAGHLSVLESLGGGVGILDYDGDGLFDIFFTGGGFFAGSEKKDIRGHSCKLYRNLGSGKFQDVTKQVGLDQSSFYSQGVAVVDYDCDGWPDLLVTGWGRLGLYHNESDGRGGRTFVDVTRRAGLPSGLWTVCAACADLDGDGFPDLFIAQYVDWSFENNPLATNGQRRDICPPKSFHGLPPKVFHNNGDGTFTDISKEAGVKSGGPDECKCLGVVIADLNGDGRPDVFVANDTVDNRLYLNRSSPSKIRFVEAAIQAGVARDNRGISTGSRGIALGDFDGNGRPSLLVTNYANELPSLYQHMGTANGSISFRFVTPQAGLAAIGQTRVGWGTAFLDVDCDGDLDLFIANGHVLRHPAGRGGRRQRPVLLRNRGHGRFVDISTLGGDYFRTDHNARGVAVVDFDNDGRADLVVSHLNEPVAILLNRAAEKEHHWIGFELIGTKRRDVVGAKVVVQTETRTQVSFAQNGGSYASSSDRRHLFGLGNTEKVKRITVYWPRAQPQQWDGLAVDRYWRLTEGEGAEEMPRRR